MLMFSLSVLTWSQNRFGGGLQTDCSVGIWNATALEALISINAFLLAVEVLSAEQLASVVNTLKSGPFRLTLSSVL